MKSTILYLGFILFMIASCKKSTPSYNNGGYNNASPSTRPPVANAGNDTIITLPFMLASNRFNLNGNASSDPDNNIVTYKWKPITVLPSFTILLNPGNVQAQVVDFIEGIYQFELEVTDEEGLLDRDTVQVEVRLEPNQQNLGNVCFYFSDPTGTIPFTYYCDYSHTMKLITVKVNNLSDTLFGFWGPNDSPRCPVSTDYNAEPENRVIFNLSPGQYTWTAQSSICDFSPFKGLSITEPFIQFFLSPHTASGTITVRPGDNCIIQQIAF